MVYSLLQINVPTDIDGIDLIAEKIDRQQLIDLLKHMLYLDQDRRIKPDEALNHPFQTLSHLADYVHCTTYVCMHTCFIVAVVLDTLRAMLCYVLLYIKICKDEMLNWDKIFSAVLYGRLFKEIVRLPTE